MTARLSLTPCQSATSGIHSRHQRQRHFHKIADARICEHVSRSCTRWRALTVLQTIDRSAKVGCRDEPKRAWMACDRTPERANTKKDRMHGAWGT
jgi:hypothetical protein